jgi:hypothetical protein
VRKGLALVCLFVLACDPGYQLTGTVESSAGKPIAGAQVTAVCPKPPNPSATSDATGKLDGKGTGFFADDCTIEVTAPGHAKQVLPVAANCAKRYLGSCLHVDVKAVLAPTP